MPPLRLLVVLALSFLYMTVQAASGDQQGATEAVAGSAGAALGGAAVGGIYGRGTGPHRAQPRAATPRSSTSIPTPSEVTTLTNVQAEIASAEVLSQYTAGSGFSGVYNPVTGQWVALASGEVTLVSGQAVQTVPQLGGHAAAEAALVARTGIADTSGNVGFALVWEGSNTVRIRWNSGQINLRNFGNRAAPAEFRAAIREAIESTTGARVIE